jgi:type II secretory pathway pseudopilin PulG
VKPFATQFRKSKRRAQTGGRSRPREEGYILLVLLLVVALMAIVTLTVTVPIKFETQRDQEQEMIHRGVQYTRAIRGFYKKFGRYPTKLEDLDNTNNLRYLRKHYKDPLNKNQDFRLLHFGEPGVSLALSGGIGGGSIPGASAVGAPNAAGASGSAFGGSTFGGGNSAFGGGAGNSAFGGAGGSGFGGNSAFGGNSGVNSQGVFAQSGPGGSSNGGFGAGSNSQTPGGQPGAGQDPSQPGSQTPGTPGQGDASSSPGSSTSSFGQQLVASGPIVGVASICKKDTIRQFNKKKKYNEWQFIYDPSMDRGGLITTPYQPLPSNFMSPGGQNLNGQNGQPGSTNSSPFGQSSSFGGSSSFGNGQNSSFGNGQNSGYGNQNPQPTPPPSSNSPQ